MPDGHGVEQLTLGHPAPAMDEVGTQEGEEDVAAAVEDRANLERGRAH
jgi:hypothetical protein